MDNKKEILIDTDIGDDIDDALALALALRSPELNLLAVTTVFKNTAERAKLAHALLKKYNRTDIPVYEGIAMPMVNEVSIKDIPCQCAAIEDDDYVKRDEHAIDVIIDTVKAYPALTILAIGPLTNIALAILKAPEVMAKANIVLMGGAFGTTEPEWNIFCDPEAASVVFRSGANIKAIGLDVTTRCTLSKENEAVAKACVTEEAAFLMKLFAAWHKASGYGITLHDPLIIGAIINPKLVRYEERKIVIELRGENTRGATIVKQSFFKTFETPNAAIATSVESEEFVDFFMKRVFPNPLQ